MKIFIPIAITILFLSSLINAASLKNLSEKLSTSFSDIVDDKTKEKVPSNFREDADDVISELDKLKAHKDVKANTAASIDEQVENSLKKLHNSHHKSTHERGEKEEEETHKSSIHSSEENFSNVQKQKEVIENLPLPDASEVSTSGKIGHRLSMKNEKSSVISPATMLRQLNGKFSAYDIAQYIFWSGDESGVASAIEELISENLMSRENAIEFLNDIRLGIDYLENTYSIKQNEGKNIHFGQQQQQSKTTTTTTTQEPSVIDDIPFSYSYNYQKFHSFFKPTNKDKDNAEEDQTPTLSPAAIKALEKIPSLIKLTEAHRDNKQKPELSFEVDESGRERLADFLFGEYSLEEVIYQLAKTMFTQSLTSGSEESQTALQKLTQFLENEGKHGRISPTLQKKILDVLLAALSDTLSENPEVMEKAARHALTAK
ncbi:hypothetical protein PVAND_000555 [Polypedilum vanderplanki]|uniref:Uncharacterized protein n=1 Tax=Polypedilum vanderplanki TaxID=319348 RepID=A0A9J6BLM5_POLVA|nr:hypothetical protein PVAND_000555 [Polypedilum vanderplanki]